MVQLNNEDVRFFDVIDVLDTIQNKTRRFIAIIPGTDFIIRIYEELPDALVFITQIPGSKHGAVKLESKIGGLVVYYTSRPINVTTGPFFLTRHDVDISNLYPIDEVASARLVKIVKQLDTHLTNLIASLKPFE